MRKIFMKHFLLQIQILEESRNSATSTDKNLKGW